MRLSFTFTRIVVLALVVAAAACGSPQVESRTLDAREVYQVSAVDAVRAAGYVVSSEVCEVESPSPYRQGDRVFGGRLFFHAFRGTHAREEKVLLFASNHPAAGGPGLVIPVNPEASAVDRDFPNGASLRDPIRVETPGADVALACARNAGPPPSLEIEGLDIEAWRRTTARRFGPERTNSDGSQDDYVRLALGLCKEDQSQLRSRMGRSYEGSLQQHVASTFCPHL